MPDWEERVTRESEPAIRAEHELRYAIAAPLIAGAALWCDLGCGSGVAAAGAIAGAEAPGRLILVDIAQDALDDASREVGFEGVVAVAADMATEEGVDRVRAEVLKHAQAGTRVVTCFETVEHLGTFVPLVELLTELAEEHGFTVLLSVPNDAFWSLENPHHRTMWGEGAFDELRSLLPVEHVVLRQLPLQGSAIVPGERPERRDLAVDADPGGVPSHFLVAIGPERERVIGGACVVQADLQEQRRWERQREADLPYLAELQREVRTMSKEFADWRTYIHELESRLGLPLSGVEPGEPPPSGNGASPGQDTQRLEDPASPA